MSSGARHSALLALMFATVCAADASAAQHRGPVLPVIRPSATMFPDRVNTEVRGDVSLTQIASAAWVGPRVEMGDWRRGPSGDYARGWMREEPTAWDRLKAEHDSSFGEERPGEFRGR